MFMCSGQMLKSTSGAEKIIHHKMKQESSLYLLHDNQKKKKKKLSLNELCIVLLQEQWNDLSERKRNTLLLKMPWGLKEIGVYVLNFYNLNYIRRV